MIVEYRRMYSVLLRSMVVGQFTFAICGDLSRSRNTLTKSSIDHTWVATPASMAGVVLIDW